MRRLTEPGTPSASRRASTLFMAVIGACVMMGFTGLSTSAANGMGTLILEKADTPKDLFLEAYKAFESAKREEVNDQFGGALARYREAERILRKVVKEYPHWNPAIVDFRLKKTLEAIARLTKSIPKPGPLPEA